MVRFVFCSDTHLGAMPLGYTQQPGYAEKLPEIVAALDEWIHQQGDIDFVIHGGDMINRASPDLMDAAADLFNLSVPVHLCLGNHDMWGAGAPGQWLAHAPGLFADGATRSRIEDRDVVIHILPCHWAPNPFSWDEGNTPRFSEDQLAWLGDGLGRHTDRPHMLVTHAQVLGAPAEQTGLGQPLLPATEAFAATVAALAEEYPALRCVLSGHTHLNMHVHCRGVHYVTTSALPESPFEFKVVCADPRGLALSTVGLGDAVDFAPQYDFDKTFVQGRPVDRQFADPPRDC